MAYMGRRPLTLHDAHLAGERSQREITTLTKSHADREQRLVQEIQRLHERLQEKASEHATLQQDAHVTERILRDTRVDIAHLLEYVDTLTATIGALKTEKHIMEEHHLTQTREMESMLSTTRADKESSFVREETVMTTLRHQIQTREEELARQRMEAESLQSTNQRLVATNKTMESEILQQSTAISDLEDELRMSREQTDQVASSAAGREVEVQQQNQMLTQRLRDMEQRYTQQLGVVEEHRKELRVKCETWEEANRRLEQQHTQLGVDRDRLAERVAGHQTELQERDAQMKDIQGEVRRWQEAAEGKATAVGTLEAEVDRLQRLLQSTTDSQQRSHESETARLTSTVETQQTQLLQAQQLLAAEQQNVQQLCMQSDKLQREVHEAEVLYRQMEERYMKDIADARDRQAKHEAREAGANRVVQWCEDRVKELLDEVGGQHVGAVKGLAEVLRGQSEEIWKVKEQLADLHSGIQTNDKAMAEAARLSGALQSKSEEVQRIANLKTDILRAVQGATEPSLEASRLGGVLQSKEDEVNRLTAQLTEQGAALREEESCRREKEVLLRSALQRQQLLEADVERWRCEAERLREENTRFVATEAPQQEIALLRERLESLGTRLHSESADREADHHRMSVAFQKQEREAERLERQLDTLQHQLEADATQRRDLQDAVTRAEKLQRQAEEKAVQLQSDLDQRQATINSLQLELATWREKSEASETSLLVIQQEVEQLTSTLTMERQVITQQRGVMGGLDEKLRNMTHTQGALERQVADAEEWKEKAAQVEHLNRIITEIKTEAEWRLSTAHGEVASLDRTIFHAHGEIAALRRQLHRFGNHVRDLSEVLPHESVMEINMTSPRATDALLSRAAPVGTWRGPELPTNHDARPLRPIAASDVTQQRFASNNESTTITTTSAATYRTEQWESVERHEMLTQEVEKLKVTEQRYEREIRDRDSDVETLKAEVVRWRTQAEDLQHHKRSIEWRVRSAADRMVGLQGSIDTLARRVDSNDLLRDEPVRRGGPASPISPVLSAHAELSPTLLAREVTPLGGSPNVGPSSPEFTCLPASQQGSPRHSWSSSPRFGTTHPPSGATIMLHPPSSPRSSPLPASPSLGPEAAAGPVDGEPFFM